ncbi:MAG TPA: S1 RNA-binding domain-containing protein, partial [Bacteroidales bacterium]
LRIRNGVNPLDGSAVHPENYNLVKKMIMATKLELNEVIGNKKAVALINPEEFVTEEFGLPTLTDILSELEKPGRDPRNVLKRFEFDKRISKIEDLQPGMLLPAIVSNLTAFGAFVDIGIHESGLIHKSQIANEFVSNPADYLKLNQQLTVKVLEVDVERKRIGLSLLGIETKA